VRALREVATLVWKELLVLARDRQAAVLLFGMPAVFVLLLSLALQEVYSEKLGLRLGLVLEIEDRGELARRIGRELAAEGELRLVARPEGMGNAELFRRGIAHAAVRIPDGFSTDAAELLGSEGRGEIRRRIEWEASPALDASYRQGLAARLAIACLKLVREELERGQAELGRELAAMGSELERMGTELERTGAMLEETGALLASTSAELVTTAGMLVRAVALLGGTVRELEEAGVLAALETAAGAEAAAVRAELARRGALPEGVLLEEPPRPTLSFEPPGRDGPRPSSPRVALEERPAREPGVRAKPEADPGVEGAVAEAARGASAGERPAAQVGAGVFLAETGAERRALPTPLQQTVPGWSLFAMFFLVVPLAHGLFRERADGTLRRILALGVPEPVLVLGKLLAFVLVASLQFAGMLAVGLYVLPLVSDLTLALGEHPLTLLPITLVCALAATSYGLLVATLARTSEQAAAVGATSVIVLAVLGGVMVPHFVMPAVLQRLALLSPLYWGHKAYLDAFVHGASLEKVAGPLLVLVAFAALCLAFAVRRVAPRA
jgi:ABC-type Na+ efflux pump permease subunit